MDATKVTYQQFIPAATDVLASGMRAVLVDGPPGCGKTAARSYLAEKLGLQHIYMIKPGHHDVLDFQGLPVPDHKKKATFFYPSGDLLPPYDLQGGCLMVLDEAGDCPVPVQNLLCQMTLEGGLHSYQFPENTKFLLTANRVADRSGANRIVTKLGNRVAWFTLEPTVSELVTYGMKSGWNPTVLAFLKQRGGEQINPNDRVKDKGMLPTYFNSFDPTDNAQLVKPIFASSRSWEYVSNLFNYIEKNKIGVSDPDLMIRTAALIGTPVAAAIVPYRSEAQHMPDPDMILAGKSVPLPTKQTVLWALTMSLVSRVKKGNWKHMDAWMQKLPQKEYRVLAVRMAFDTKAAELIGPDFNATLQEADMNQAISGREK